MVSVNLKGGLGNMLFQIAFIEDMARRGGFEVRYPDIDYVFQTLLKSGHSQNCYDYLKIFKNFDWLKNQDKPMPNRICHIPYKYVNLTPTDNVIYDGYFQSERYFDRKETLKLFEPADFIKEKLPFRTMPGVTSVHVRRGDFLNPQEININLGMDYYWKAYDMIMDAMRDNTDSYLFFKRVFTFKVFSDDYVWCKERFDGFSFYDKEPIDYIELFWMSMCENNIIANSSFSWWGAYLNQNPDKKVIAPAAWYKPGSGLSAEDVYCKNMIII
jgi:hypothetical protein